MEFENPLIYKSGDEDIELATKRTTAYDASLECISVSVDTNNIIPYDPSQPRSLITIISITIWVIFIKKAKTTINTTTMNEPKFNKWKQNAVTVAGGNGEGQELNQLNSPYGIFIDRKTTIFIADNHNDRIAEWNCDAKEGQIAAGGNEQGNQMNQLNGPTSVIVNQQNYSLIITDSGNRRVIQWVNQTQQILIQNIDCYGLAIDKYGFLYISDSEKNEVRRWQIGEYNTEGIVVAGGNGQGNLLNQLNSPSFIFVDEDQSIYVSDENNNRVMKWTKDAKEGIVVAGGNDEGRNLSQVSSPQGLVVNDFGQIYVADCNNHRVMRWHDREEEGEIVVGGNSGGNQSNQLHCPMGLSFDDEGNLYVADFLNSRIQKFELIL
ncbi:unnamed protein product [Adineta steineri]|uniref:NHL repeat containing protein n=1 Tax=Adineta steineri TaxID=433720 RepID=A0A819TKN9_9BILA|nr:unnamed protein product [Adineta steineri]CAF1003895.1 unnamed protein product [Adineta steineri]CAF3557569.1 unnamed protein product [Adineta steineri]CAF3990853.1 unnamed protein product [Adineta steineri]CAF4079885.1 unnamed protein product [Adineta steineri]